MKEIFKNNWRIDPNYMPFSMRLVIAKMVTDWYDKKNPPIPVCTINTITALSTLGLLKKPKRKRND